jgi:acyl-CoA synthetase (NDP forming)
VISSGFSEVADGVALEKKLVAAAKKGGCRVLGPNCLGLYSPRGKVTFPDTAPKEVGSVGVISQSGGLGTDIVTRGDRRGIRFSGLVTVGNSADLGPNDMLEFYLADPVTKVVGMYVEGVADGRRFFDVLKKNGATKPVVVLKGGRTQKGQAAAASHTGSLAGDDRVWVALSRQTGCVLVDTLDEFLDALLAFQTLTMKDDRATKQVALFGNGGGTSVLATDFFYRCGLDIDPFDRETFSGLDALNLPPGTSIANPVDAPVGTLQQEEGRIAEKILDVIYSHAKPDAIVMHLNLAAFVNRGPIDPLDNLITAAVHMQAKYPGQAHFLLVLRSSGDPAVEEGKQRYRERAMSVGIPVYDELSNAAVALSAVSRFEAFRAGRG